jgi:hypothetical protein
VIKTSNLYEKCPNCGKPWSSYEENSKNINDEYKPPAINFEAQVRFYCGGSIYLKSKVESLRHLDKDRMKDTAKWSPVCPGILDVAVPEVVTER